MTHRFAQSALYVTLLGLALGSDRLAAQSEADRVTVFRGGQVWDGVAERPIENGVVIMEGGKIRAVGDADTVVPAGATVVDCTGKVLTPGLVDASTTLGVRSTDANEQADEVTPAMRILDAIDPSAKSFERARNQGVTTAQISPGNRNVIGGLGAILKTAGTTVEEMLVRDSSCLRMTLGSEPSSGNRAIRFGAPTSLYFRRPTTRMGVVWAVRKAFYDARAYQERKTDGEALPASSVDPDAEVLVQALEGKLQVRTTARAEQDIRTALRLAEEFGIKPVLEEATEAYRLIKELRAAGSQLVFGAPSKEVGRDGAQVRWNTLNELAKAEIPFAIATGGNIGTHALRLEAMFAVRNGLPAAAALRAITSIPAEILGVADRVGTLAVDRDADLVVWTGSPFDPTTRPDSVWIQGRRIDD